jgi:tetratricopeptide (TPR) repeat protein
VAARIPAQDQRIIITEGPNHTAKLDQVADRIANELENQFSQFQRYTHEQWVLEQSKQKADQQKSAAFMNALSMIYSACLDTADGVDEVNDQLIDTNNHLENLGVSLEKVNANLRNLSEGQAESVQHLITVQKVLKENHQDTKGMLKGLFELGIEEAKKESLRHEETHELINLTFEEIKAIFEKAVRRLVFVLSIIEQNLQYIGKEIVGAIGSLHETSKKMLDKLNSIQDETVATRRAISAQTSAIVDTAASWLEIQSDQYVSQGQKLLEHGHTDEAIKALKRAVKSDPCNGNAQHLLGQAYAKKHNYSKAKTHLNVAVSFVKTAQECTNISVELLKIAAYEKDFEAIITLTVDVVLSNPSLYCFEKLGDIPEVKSRKDLIFEALITAAQGDPTVLALCAIELTGINPQKAKLALDKLVKEANLENIHLSIDVEVWQKFEEMLSIFIRTLKQYAEPDNLRQMPLQNIWWLMKIFIDQGRALNEARGMLVWLYKHNTEIASHAKNYQFQKIAEVIKAGLGPLASQVKKFGEIPREIRQYIQ